MKIKKKIKGVLTEVHPFAFDGTAIQFNKIQLYDEKSPNLANCMVASVGDHKLIRSSLIDTKQKGDQLLELAEHPGRFCLTQCDSAEKEWGLIDLQHEVIEQYVNHFVHLLTPTEPLVLLHHEPTKSVWERKVLNRMTGLMNEEAWVTYCAWLNEELDDAVEHFKYDAAEEYRLEGVIKNFSHEVKSSLLAQTRKEIRQLIAKMGDKFAKGEQKGLLDDERRLIELRTDLRRMVEDHARVLDLIIENIESIEKSHPHLVALKVKGELLASFLKNQGALPWGVQQMLIQILNDELGVVSAINSAHGLDRTHVAFAIRLAVLQMKKLYPVIDLIKMARYWGEGDLVEPFLSRVHANFTEFCYPLTEWNKRTHTFEWYEDSTINPDLKEFVPEDFFSRD